MPAFEVETVLPRLSAFNSRAILGGFAGFLRRGPVRALVSVADEHLLPSVLKNFQH
jgi:hypothetical protein